MRNLKKLGFMMVLAAVFVLNAYIVSASTADGVQTERASETAWNIITISGVPANVQKMWTSATVYNLVDGVDTGVTFKCTEYRDLYYNGGFYAMAGLNDTSLQKNESDYVKLSYVGDKGTVLFKQDWYAYCGGSVQFYIRGCNMVEYGNQSMSGIAY